MKRREKSLQSRESFVFIKNQKITFLIVRKAFVEIKQRLFTEKLETIFAKISI